MWKFGIFLTIFVYLIVIASLITAIRLSRKIIGSKSDYAEKQTAFVVLFVLITYLVPIVGMSISFFYNSLIAYIIGLSMLLSIFPITYFVIIPLCDKRKLKYVEEKYGKDSSYAEYLRNKHKQNKKI